MSTVATDINHCTSYLFQQSEMVYIKEIWGCHYLSNLGRFIFEEIPGCCYLSIYIEFALKNRSLPLSQQSCRICMYRNSRSLLSQQSSRICIKEIKLAIISVNAQNWTETVLEYWYSSDFVHLNPPVRLHCKDTMLLIFFWSKLVCGKLSMFDRKVTVLNVS